MNELLCNGEGYTDYTAYRAIALADREERKRMGNQYEMGDVVEVETMNGGVREAILLKCHEMYASAIYLVEDEPRECALKVYSRKIMYTDTGKAGYVFYDKIQGLVKQLSEAELSALCSSVANSLGVAQKNERAAVAKPQVINYAIDAQNNELKLRAELQKVREKMIEAVTERNVYKELYFKVSGLERTEQTKEDKE